MKHDRDRRLHGCDAAPDFRVVKEREEIRDCFPAAATVRGERRSHEVGDRLSFLNLVSLERRDTTHVGNRFINK